MAGGALLFCPMPLRFKSDLSHRYLMPHMRTGGFNDVGHVENAEYYKKTVGALEIPDSFPGIYKNRIQK